MPSLTEAERKMHEELKEMQEQLESSEQMIKQVRMQNNGDVIGAITRGPIVWVLFCVFREI